MQKAEAVSYTHLDVYKRQVLGDPWLIKEIATYLATGEKLPPVSVNEKFTMARLHAKRLCDLKGEHVGMREMRGHAAWYVKGLPKSHQLKDLSLIHIFHVEKPVAITS